MALILFGATKTPAIAGEDSLSGSTPSIDWGSTNPLSLIPNPPEAATQATSNRQAMYRLYNKYTGEHHYTASASERDKVIAAGWNDEGVGWYAPSTSNTPVYRLYNSYAPGGEHHYTMSKEEVNKLVKAGWSDEGRGWYSVDEKETDKTPVYRQYNPNAFSCNHNYTIDTEEKDYVIKAGWNDEGIGWYGFADAESDTPSQALDFSKITVSTTAKTYNGKAQTQTVTSSAYKLNTDYTVTYSNNKNAGTASIVVKGKGNYTGTKTYKFTINKLNISNATVTLGTALTYNTKEQTQSIESVKVGSLALLTSDYTVTNNKGTDAGDYTLTVTGKGNYTGTKTYKFTINKLNISNATVTLGTALTYNTKEQTQSIESVKVGSLALLTSDYTVTNNKGTDAGDYTLTVTGKGNFTGSVSKAFTVAKAKPVCVTPAGLTGYFSDTLSSVDVESETVAANTPGKFAWAEGTQLLDVLGEKEFNTTFTPSDVKNYLTVENISVKVSIASRGYWLGTKNAGAEFVDEAYFAKNDSNYVSGANIAADVKVLHDSTDTNYATVKDKWDKYYSDDNVRLYATYDGGENEGSYDSSSTTRDQGVTSKLNKYVEFRILEVSGADGHKLSSGGSDGSAVTFMATHVLPTAYRMNTGSTNEGGWGACQLYKDMNKVGETKGDIYKKFSDDFVSKVKKVTKEYNTGGSSNSQTATPGTVDCQFWIPSYTELVSATAIDYPSTKPKLEGTQYAWCAKNVTNADSGNPCLIYTTRGDATPGSCGHSDCFWWERSPCVGGTSSFGYVNSGGNPNNGGSYAYRCLGVTPAFAF